jgi:hypothetical protein
MILTPSYFIHGSFWLELYILKRKKQEGEEKKERDDYHCNCIEKSKSTRKLQVTQREKYKRKVY